MKRVGIFTWILGWGVYSNARSISKIKDNLHTLQKQKWLQDEQIKCLAKFLNLTMHQVSRHSEMLYEMDTKMFIINNTLQHIMWNIDALCIMNLTYYITFKLEYIEYILLYMPLGETLNHYMNI